MSFLYKDDCIRYWLDNVIVGIVRLMAFFGVAWGIHLRTYPGRREWTQTCYTGYQTLPS